MDDLFRLKQAQQQQYNDRITDLKRRAALEQETEAAGQLVGFDKATGQPLVSQGSGAPVPMVAQSNVSAPVGKIGRASGGRFDVGSRRTGAEVERRVKVGDVKIFIRGERDGFYEFWLGGDRATELQIAKIATSAETVINAYAQVYGPGKNDWIFSIKSRSVADPTLFTVRTFRGDGSNATYTNKRAQYLNYFGRDFWQTNLLTFGTTAQYSTTTLTPAVLGAQGTGFFNGGIFGGFGNSIEWNIDFPYWIPGATSSTSGYDKTLASFAVVPSAITEIFPAAVSGSSNESARTTVAWVIQPGPPGGQGDIDALTERQGAPCDRGGYTATFNYGRQSQNSTFSKLEAFSQNNFHGYLVNDSFQVEAGQQSSGINESRESNTLGAGGATVTVTAACVESFDKIALFSSRTSGTSGSQLISEERTTTASNTITKTIVPGLSLADTFTDVVSYTRQASSVGITNSETISQTRTTERQNYNTGVFFGNADKTGYYYQSRYSYRRVKESPLPFQVLEEVVTDRTIFNVNGTILTFDFILSAPLTGSVYKITGDDKLELLTVEPPSGDILAKLNTDMVMTGTKQKLENTGLVDDPDSQSLKSLKFTRVRASDYTNLSVVDVLAYF